MQLEIPDEAIQAFSDEMDRQMKNRGFDTPPARHVSEWSNAEKDAARAALSAAFSLATAR